MEFSRDGSVLAVAGSGASGRQGQVLQLWSVADGRHIRNLPGADGNEDFALSPDGKSLAVPINRAGEVVLWDVPGGKELRRLNHPGVRGVYFSPVGHVLASRTAKVDADCNRDELFVWDTTTGKQLYATTSRPEIHTTFAADGRLLFWGYDRRLRCWDPVTRKERPPVVIPPDTDGYLTPSPSGTEVLAVDSKSGRIRLQDATTLKVLRGFGDGKDALFTSRIDAAFTPGGTAFLEGKDLVETEAFTRDGKQLLVGRESGRVEVWETATGKRLSSFIRPDREMTSVPSVYPVPDGKHVMVRQMIPTSTAGIVYSHTMIYSLDGRVARRAPAAWQLEFDPSGRCVAVWDVVPGEADRRRTITIHDAAAWLAGGAKKD
jgi:WD40 repeat protein